MKLFVVMVDDCQSIIDMQHFQESTPYKRRVVSVELSEEQARKLRKKRTGENMGEQCFEFYGNAWIEEE